MRTKNTSVFSIFYFLLLKVAPTFFEQLPVSTWLASGLLIRELYFQQELDTLLLISFNFRQIFKLFFIAGLILTVTSFIINESLISKITFKAEQYKIKEFKQTPTQKLINKWIELESNVFCYFNVLDFNENRGQDLYIIYITPEFTIQKTITAPVFSIDASTQSIKIEGGKYFDTEQNVQENIDKMSIKNPSFFSQVSLYNEPISSINLSKTIIKSHNIIPKNIKSDLIGQLVEKILDYLLLLLYPILTFGLFAIFWRKNTLKWLAILAPYPIFIASKIISNNNIINYWPYFLIVILIFIIYYRIE